MNSSSFFLPYITAGDPDMQTTKLILKELESCGAGMIELGIPFSDPSADGTTNQLSFERSLEQGFNWQDLFQILEELKIEGFSTPLILFGYLNPFLQFGIDSLAKRVQDLGVRGLLILDLPFEYSDSIRSILSSYEMNLISLVTPTTSEQRLKLINEKAKGFVYCVARAGVTGSKTQIDQEIKDYLRKVKNFIRTTPLAVGFGINHVEQVKDLKPYCEGIVVGSALVKIIEKNVEQPKLIVEQVGELVRELIKPLKN